MTDELKPCPFCGSVVRWCDSSLDEEGHAHQCEHIVCESCQVSMSLTGYGHEGCETYAEAKEKMLRIFNARAIPSTHRIVSAELLREAMTASYLSNPGVYDRLSAIIDNSVESKGE